MHPVVSLKVCLMLLCTFCVIGACKAVETAVPFQATLGGHIEYSFSGGISGNMQNLTIDDAGRIKARDDKHRKIARGQLDPARLVELRAAFMKINENPETAKQHLGGRCADCYHYSVVATIGGRQHRVDVNSTVLQASSYGEIVRSLSQILSETLSPPVIINE